MKMNHYKIIFSVFITVILMLVNSDKSNNIPEVKGTYISTTPGLSDKLSIMYIRGHFNFLSSTAGQEKLELKSDKSFIHSFTTCKNGVKDVKGIYKVSENKLILDYTATHHIKTFMISNESLYIVDSILVSANKKYIPHLSLLKKQ